MFKLTTLTELEPIIKLMSSEQQDDFHVPELTLTYALIGCTFGALLLSGGVLVVLAVREHAEQRRKALAEMGRRLRCVKTGETVDVPTIDQCDFHIFLSHVW